MRKHRHHVVPKHAGGTDDPSNIVLLTIEEHAAAHKLLYEQYGRWQDKFAWLLLSGLVTKDELRHEMAQRRRTELQLDAAWLKEVAERRSQGVKRWYAGGAEPWNKGKKCPIISENVKRQAKTPNFHCIGDHNRGKNFTEDHKNNLRNRALARTKLTCVHCGVICQPAMHTRWHGDKCRMKPE